MKLFSNLLVKLIFLSLIVISSLSVSFLKANAAPISEDTYTYTVCYFQKDNDETWQWGLNSDKSWYELKGRWKKSDYTGNTFFETSVGREDIAASCIESRKYYKKGGYTIHKIYAADSSAGSNYPIRSNGNILYE